MRYEAIFERLDGIFLSQAGMKPEDFLALGRESIQALQEEIFQHPGPSVRGIFQIVMRDDLVFGRFVEVELQHRIAGAWQTRAVGFLDTSGVTRVLYAYRCETLGGPQRIAGSEWKDPNKFRAPRQEPGLQVPLSRLDVRAEKMVLKLLQAQAEQWEADTLQAA